MASTKGVCGLDSRALLPCRYHHRLPSFHRPQWEDGRTTELSTLQQKLELTRLPDELEGGIWDYGVPRADIERLLQHWKNG